MARYFTTYDRTRLRSVVFAAAVPPYMAKTEDNPDGPLTSELAEEMESGLKDDEATFYDGFVTDFFSVDGELRVSEAQRQDALSLTRQADKKAALKAMEAFGATDFREDLTHVNVPTLVIHGDGDGTVPFEGSGARTHEVIRGSQLHVIAGAPHGCNVSHAEEFNRVLLEFLAHDPPLAEVSACGARAAGPLEPHTRVLLQAPSWTDYRAASPITGFPGWFWSSSHSQMGDRATRVSSTAGVSRTASRPYTCDSLREDKMRSTSPTPCSHQ